MSSWSWFWTIAPVAAILLHQLMAMRAGRARS